VWLRRGVSPTDEHGACMGGDGWRGALGAQLRTGAARKEVRRQRFLGEGWGASIDLERGAFGDARRPGCGAIVPGASTRRIVVDSATAPSTKPNSSRRFGLFGPRKAAEAGDLRGRPNGPRVWARAISISYQYPGTLNRAWESAALRGHLAVLPGFRGAQSGPRSGYSRSKQPHPPKPHFEGGDDPGRSKGDKPRARPRGRRSETKRLGASREGRGERLGASTSTA